MRDKPYRKSKGDYLLVDQITELIQDLTAARGLIEQYKTSLNAEKLLSAQYKTLLNTHKARTKKLYIAVIGLTLTNIAAFTLVALK